MKPIMMSTEDVQAVLEGRKTMMRRVVKEDRRGEWAAVNGVRKNSEYGASVPCYLHRETAVDDISRNIMYPNYDVGDILPIRWRPSIHMPREAARLFLRVTDVRVERLQNISAEDCEAEGYFETAPVEPRPRSWFSEVWNARNAKRGYGWDSNPWVWVYTFERITKEEGEHGH
jgi:hypothetical protein